MAVWAVLAVGAFALAPKLQGIQQNDAAAFLPVSAQSTQVIEDAKKFGAGDKGSVVVLYERLEGLKPADFQYAQDNAKQLVAEGIVADDPASYVKGQTGPVLGPIPDKSLNAMILEFKVPVTDGLALGKTVESVTEIVGTNHYGMKVYVTGPVAAQAELVKVFESIDTTLLAAAGLVVIIILLITYRSPFLWLIPIVAVLVADNSAQALNYLLAEPLGLKINGQSTALLLVLVFGAGTDYALLLVARYREELRRFEDKHDAMAEALYKAAPAIVASAATVIIGLLCLLASTLASNKGMGPVSAVGIAVALVTMLTLFPALLVAVGRRPFWPLIPRYGSEVHEESGPWAHVAAWVARRPRTIWIVTALVLGAMALGVASLNGNGIPQSEAYKTKPLSVIGQERLGEYFPAGAGNPVVVVSTAESAEQVAKIADSTQDISASGIPAQVKDGLALQQFTLDVPGDGKPAQDAVVALRESLAAQAPQAEARVGGGTAVQVDVNAAAQHDRTVVIPLVLIVVLSVLVLLLRSLVAPVLLMATVVLSFFASIGASAWLFEHVFGFAGVDSSYVLFTFIFLVALGIDYNIFLMHRVREESGKIGTRPGVLKGLAVTGGVITSAGVVLAGTFAVLGVLPVVFLFEIGFTVAFGVILDTFIVRSILVPALAFDIGPPIWWPSRLRTETPSAPEGAQEWIAVADGTAFGPPGSPGHAERELV